MPINKADISLVNSSLALVVALVLAVGNLSSGCQRTPVPPPQLPTPPAAANVVVVYESGDQAVPLAALEARTKLPDVGFVVIDDDVETGDGETPAELAAAIAAARDSGLPAIVILDAAGEVLRVAPLPATAAEIIDLVNG